MTIREARLSRGLAQQELASRAHVSLPVISRMETGKPVQRSSFLLVCQALGVREQDIQGVNISSQLGRTKTRVIPVSAALSKEQE